VLAFAVIALSGLVRLPAAKEPFWNVDEAISACVGNKIVEGGVPYRDSVDHRGPVTYYAYAAIFLMFGKNNMSAVHISLAVLIMAVEVILYELARSAVNRRAGVIAVIFFAVLSFVPFRAYDMLAAHTEWFQIAFSVTGALFLIKGVSRNQTQLLAISGMFYGFGYLAKQPGLLDFAGAIGYLLLRAYSQGVSTRLIVRVVALLTGFLSINLIAVGYFASHSALGDFFFYVWTYNTKYYLPAVSLSERLDAYARLAFTLSGDILPFMLLFIAAVIQQARLFLGKLPGTIAAEAQLFFVCWSAGSLVGALMSGREFGHYFIQALPSVALVTAVWCDRYLTSCNAFRLRRQTDPPPVSLQSVGFGRALALALFLASLALPIAAGFRRVGEVLTTDSPVDRSSEVRAEVRREAVATIQELASPSSRMFIWGWYSELYILAGVQSASRYTAANWLTGLIPWQNVDPQQNTEYAIIPGTRKILLSELSQNPPAVILDTSPSNLRFYGKYPLTSFPELSTFVRKQYALIHRLRAQDGKVLFDFFQRLDLGGGSSGLLSMVNYDRPIYFREREGAECLQRVGWSHPEENYTWTDGPIASLVFRVPQSAAGVQLRFNMCGMNVPGLLPFQRVLLSVNGAELASWNVAEQAEFIVDVPQQFVSKPDPLLSVEFSIPDAASPSSLTHSGDNRRLGLRISEMAIFQVSPDGQAGE
jgi:hypothetical protein